MHNVKATVVTCRQRVILKSSCSALLHYPPVREARSCGSAIYLILSISTMYYPYGYTTPTATPVNRIRDVPFFSSIGGGVHSPCPPVQCFSKPAGPGPPMVRLFVCRYGLFGRPRAAFHCCNLGYTHNSTTRYLSGARDDQSRPPVETRGSRDQPHLADIDPQVVNCCVGR